MKVLSRSVLLFLVVLILFSFSVFVLVFSGILFAVLYSKSTEETFISEMSTYQYQEYDPSSKSTTNGFVTMSKKLSDDDFVSYHNKETGSSIIISNFADSQYECSGSCRCSSTQRRSTTILTRSLYILFSAVTSSLAFTIAEKAFHDQCVARFADTCDEENIQSEVQSCSEKEEKESKEEDNSLEYSCEGHCSAKKIRNNSPSTLRAQRSFFENIGPCERLKTMGYVNIKRTVMEYETKVTRLGKERLLKQKYSHLFTLARQEFSRKYLTDFCKDASRIRYLYVRPTGRTQKVEASMCVSRGDSRVKGYSLNNIKCVMISGDKRHEFVNQMLKERWESE